MQTRSGVTDTELSEESAAAILRTNQSTSATTTVVTTHLSRTLISTRPRAITVRNTLRVHKALYSEFSWIAGHVRQW